MMRQLLDGQAELRQLITGGQAATQAALDTMQRDQRTLAEHQAAMQRDQRTLAEHQAAMEGSLAELRAEVRTGACHCLSRAAPAREPPGARPPALPPVRPLGRLSPT